MRIKQGNDIKVSVPVCRVNGEQMVNENMETAQNIVLLLCNNNFSSVVYKIADYSVSGNRISFVVNKAMQEVLGKYRVELKYDQPDATQADGLQTFSADKKDVFELVRFTDETDMTQVGDVTVTSVEVILGVQAGINGLSAYEMALSNGFVGTVEEWLLSLKKPAIDAALSAMQVEETIEASESLRSGEEVKRVDNEIAREEAETTREESEGTRNDNETARKAAEITRDGNETTRKDNEIARQAKETERKAAETTRQAGYTTIDGKIVQLGADLGDNIEPALAEIINHQNGRIKALEDLVKNTIFKSGQFDTLEIVKAFNIYGATNMVLIRAAAPSIVPDFVGQCYINTTGGVIYQAKGASATSDWKQTSN